MPSSTVVETGIIEVGSAELVDTNSEMAAALEVSVVILDLEDANPVMPGMATVIMAWAAGAPGTHAASTPLLFVQPPESVFRGLFTNLIAAHFESVRFLSDDDRAGQIGEPTAYLVHVSLGMGLDNLKNNLLAYPVGNAGNQRLTEVAHPSLIQSKSQWDRFDVTAKKSRI